MKSNKITEQEAHYIVWQAWRRGNQEHMDAHTVHTALTSKGIESEEAVHLMGLLVSSGDLGVRYNIDMPWYTCRKDPWGFSVNLEK